MFKQLADFKKWGVVDVGYTTEATPRSLSQYNNWVSKNNHQPLTYLEGERQEKRQSLTNYWPEFKSALVFLFSYHEAHQGLLELYTYEPSWNGQKIASYTMGFSGQDYHQELKARLEEIAEEIKKDFPQIAYKIALDTHPVLERDMAYRSGLGWFGKNSMLISKTQGSFFIIGSILFNQELPDLAEKKLEIDHCGQCTKCIDSCPTMAIDPFTRTIKAQDCISTFTIEQFKSDSVPSEKMNLSGGQLFGCDICQDVCPWNKRINSTSAGPRALTDHPLVDFFLKQDKIKLKETLTAMSEGEFRRMFKKTSFERSGKRGILKNLLFFLRNI